MTKPTKPFSLSVAIKATALALIGFTSCFFMVAGSSRSSPLPALIVTLLVEVIFIAMAIREWVLYFRAYVAQQIVEHLKNVSNTHEEMQTESGRMA